MWIVIKKYGNRWAYASPKKYSLLREAKFDAKRVGGVAVHNLMAPAFIEVYNEI